ncbi:hypothetical protein ABIE33_007133, partial [Ensifer sp. 4252]
GGLDRSAKLLKTLHKTRQPARVSHDFSAGPPRIMVAMSPSPRMKTGCFAKHLSSFAET